VKSNTSLKDPPCAHDSSRPSSRAYNVQSSIAVPVGEEKRRSISPLPRKLRYVIEQAYPGNSVAVRTVASSRTAAIGLLAVRSCIICTTTRAAGSHRRYNVRRYNVRHRRFLCVRGLASSADGGNRTRYTSRERYLPRQLAQQGTALSCHQCLVPITVAATAHRAAVNNGVITARWARRYHAPRRCCQPRFNTLATESVGRVDCIQGSSRTRLLSVLRPAIHTRSRIVEHAAQHGKPRAVFR